MIRFAPALLCSAALLSACTTTSIPDSNPVFVEPNRGVGFDNYEAYRDAQAAQAVNNSVVTPLAGTGQQIVTGAPVTPSTQTTLDADTQAALDSAEQNSGVLPVEASPTNPPPQVVTNSVGISDENDFDAVSGQRDIAADATLIAQNRALYQVIQPTELPVRPGTDIPNIVAYAIQTTNPVGVQLYNRLRFNAEARFARACAGYASPDLAQEDFLATGGPERDRRGVDPDGDGFACNWDPTPFRSVPRG